MNQSSQSSRVSVIPVTISTNGLKSGISQSQLKSLLHYEPDTGIFTWLERGPSISSRPYANKIWNTRFAGKPAGGFIDGYTRIWVFGASRLAHRLAWLYVYGENPGGMIDHISHVRDDNRIVNLRVVDDHANAKNRNRPKTNKSGVCGVRWEASRDRWAAIIRHHGHTYNLGRYKSFDDAVAARKAGERQYGYHPNHGVNP